MLIVTVPKEEGGLVRQLPMRRVRTAVDMLVGYNFVQSGTRVLCSTVSIYPAAGFPIDGGFQKKKKKKKRKKKKFQHVNHA